MIDLVTSPERRQGLMQNLASQWLQQDRAAAEQWIRGSALPTDVQQQLLAPPAQNNPNQINLNRTNVRR